MKSMTEFLNERFGEVKIKFTMVDWFGKNLVQKKVPMKLASKFIKSNPKMKVKAKAWWDMNELGRGKKNALDYEGDFPTIQDAKDFIVKYELHKGTSQIPIKGKETMYKASEVHIRSIWFFDEDGKQLNGFGFFNKHDKNL